MRPKIILDPTALHFLEQALCCRPLESAPGRQAWSPPTDVYEVDGAMIIRMEIAGMRAGDIQIQATDSVLVVSGQRVDGATGAKRRVSLMEMSYGPFERVVALPAAVQPDRAHASYDAGILEIHLPLANRRESRTTGVRIQLG